MSDLEKNTKVRLIIESCLQKGTKQDQTDEIIKALKKENFYIIAGELEEFYIDNYSCQ